MKKLLLLTAVLLPLFLFAQNEPQSGKFSSRLQTALDNSAEGDFIKAYILLSERVDILALKQELDARGADLQERTRTVITTLQAQAAATQGPLLQWLQEQGARELRPRWIANVIFADLTPAMLNALSRRSDVEQLDLNVPLLPDEHQVEALNVPPVPNGAEPGLKAINAHKLWELGYTGYGRKSFTSDTGIDPRHPALAGKYLGMYTAPELAWYQYNSSNTRPFDCGYHGTHVTGTILGLDRLNNDTIGVAFNALWMGGPTLCGVGTADNVEAFEWCLNPDGDENTTDDMPDVVNNSWFDPGVGGGECQSMYVDVLTALEAAGVAVVFSAGNEGPDASSITPPKNINVGLVNTFSVAALNAGNSAAGFSSNGPSKCSGTGSLKIKPEVSAPGVNVRSSFPDGQYAFLQGTSMAAPHVAGAILLLKEAFPYLTGEEIKLALYFSCTDLGPEGEDNTYGMGIIDVYAAYEYLINEGNIPVSPAFQRDLLISGVEFPNVNCDNSFEARVTVRNDGSLPISDFQVSLTVELSDPLTFNVNSNELLAPGESRVISFPTITDLPTGNRNITFALSTADGPDDRPLNDRYFGRVRISNQESPQAEWAQFNNLPACEGNSAVLKSDYDGLGVVRWYDSAEGGEMLAEGNTFVTPPLTEDQTYYSEIAYSGGGIVDFLPEWGVTPTSLDKGLIMLPLTDLTFKGFKVYAPESTGCVIRVRNITDDDLLEQKAFSLDPGENFLKFDLELEAGNRYAFIHQFGKPVFYMDREPDYPYGYGNLYQIIAGYDAGEQVLDAYYFFYDWEVEFDEKCGRNIIPVAVGEGDQGPKADFTLSDTILYLDQGPKLFLDNQSEGGFGYQWRFGDGTQSELPAPQHTYTEPGVYQVSLQVFSPNGCSDALSKTVRVLPTQPVTTATNNVPSDALDARWMVYPNPASSDLTIYMEGLQSATSLTLLSPEGKVLRQQELKRSAPQQSWSVAELPTGVYFLRLDTEQGFSVKKVTVVR